MKKVVIKTKDCFKLLKLMKKMEVFEEAKNIFKEGVSVSFENNRLQKQVKKMVDGEVTNEKVEAIFNENPSIEKQFEDLNKKQAEMSLDVVFLLVENIDKAEIDVIEFISAVYEMKIEEVEELQAGELIEKLQGILQSESFGSFFTSIVK